MEKPKLYLQAVIVKKPIELEEARKMAHSVIRDKRKTFYRETEESYRFRNLPKTYFIPGSYVTKIVNDKLSLVFGRLQSTGT